LDDALQAALRESPVIAQIKICHKVWSQFAFYSENVFTEVHGICDAVGKEDLFSHSVLIVGYDLKEVDGEQVTAYRIMDSFGRGPLVQGFDSKRCKELMKKAAKGNDEAAKDEAKRQGCEHDNFFWVQAGLPFWKFWNVVDMMYPKLKKDYDDIPEFALRSTPCAESVPKRVMRNSDVFFHSEYETPEEAHQGLDDRLSAVFRKKTIAVRHDTYRKQMCEQEELGSRQAFAFQLCREGLGIEECEFPQFSQGLQTGDFDLDEKVIDAILNHSNSVPKFANRRRSRTYQ